MAHDILRKLKASFREMEEPIKVKIYDSKTGTYKDDEIIPALFADYCDRIKSNMRNDPKLRTVIDRFPHPIIWTLHPSVNTAASDGVRIAFNPVFANYLLELGREHALKNKKEGAKPNKSEETKYLEFVILHECFHEIYRHSEQADFKPETQNGNNHYLANIAMDAEINRDIERAFNGRYAGVTKVINGIFDGRFDYESWWQIFDAYYSGQVDPPQGESNDNLQNGDSSGEGEPSDDPNNGSSSGGSQQQQITHSPEWERGYRETMEAIERGEINPNDYAFINNFDAISPNDDYENGKKAAIKDYLKMQNKNNNSNKAQQAANKAQQAANDAKNAANRGDENAAKQAANKAGNYAKEAAEAAKNSGANSNDVNNANNKGQQANNTSKDNNASAQDAADAAQDAADASQQAADAAQQSSNDNNQGNQGDQSSQGDQGNQGDQSSQGDQEGQGGQEDQSSQDSDSSGDNAGSGDGNGNDGSQGDGNNEGGSGNSISNQAGKTSILDTKDYSWDIPNVFGGADRISKEQMAQIAAEVGEGYSNDDLTADPKELSRKYNDAHEKEYNNISLGKDKDGNNITLGDKSRNLKEQLAGRQTFADWKTKMANHFHEAMKGATEFKRKRKAVSQIDWNRGYANIMKEIPKEIKNAANVFYLIDNSGSMGGEETFTQIFAEILKLEKKCHIAHSALTYFGANDHVEISKIRLWDYNTKKDKILAMIPQYNDYGGGTNILDNVISVRRLKAPYYYDDKSGHKTVLIVITDGYDNLNKIKEIPRKELRETIWLIINSDPVPVLKEIHQLGAPIKNLIGIDTHMALGQ